MIPTCNLIINVFFVVIYCSIVEKNFRCLSNKNLWVLTQRFVCNKILNCTSVLKLAPSKLFEAIRRDGNPMKPSRTNMQDATKLPNWQWHALSHCRIGNGKTRIMLQMLLAANAKTLMRLRFMNSFRLNLIVECINLHWPFCLLQEIYSK